MVRTSHFASEPSGERQTSPLTPQALTRQEFGRRLSKLILDRGWNQSELARRADLGRDAISTYVNGRSFPTPTSLEALAKAFGISREELLPNATMNAIDAEHPEFEIKVAAGHPGKAWVRLNRTMSFETASMIAAMLNEEDKRNTSE